MSRPQQLGHLAQALEKQLGSFVDLPKIAAPFTTIVGRAQAADPSRDLLPRMGVERIPIQFVQEIQAETGPSGERVFKERNDPFDRLRFVGAFSNAVTIDGTYVNSSTTEDKTIEVVFYGTGLNLLDAVFTNAGWESYRVSIDNGAATTITNAAGASTVLNGRNYAQNRIVPLVSGLALGLHTARITVGRIVLYGIEVLNEASTIKTPAGSAYLGGKKLALATLNLQSTNSSFASGTLGTKGGRVVTYLTSDGVIEKALTPTSTTQLNLSAASHSNEDLIRAYHWREFGAGRTDDFSIFGTTTFTNLAFTLDDGTTSLIGYQVRMFGVGSDRSINMANVGSFLTFTFVGTGLDISLAHDGATSTVHVDGNSLGTLGVTGTVPNTLVRTKIVSGLPYGTHTVKFISQGANLSIGDFYVYGPSKPSIPAGAVELADYYVMADFDSSAVSASVLHVATGVLRKNVSREFVFRGNGTWTLGIDPLNFAGHTASNSTGAASISEYTFCGTGFVLNLLGTGGGTVQYSIKIDGVLNATGVNLNGFTNDGSGLYTIATGSSLYRRVKFTGLTFGKHTVTVERVAGATVQFVGELDIITPIHSPKSNGPGGLQSTMMVGSCAIGDGRRFSETQDSDIPNWGQAHGVATAGSTTSTSFVPLPDMTLTIKTNGNPLAIDWEVLVNNATTNTGTSIQLFVDGVATGFVYGINVSAGGAANEISGGFILPVAAGVHILQLMWAVSSSTASLESNRRTLRAREI